MVSGILLLHFRFFCDACLCTTQYLSLLLWRMMSFWKGIETIQITRETEKMIVKNR